MRKFTVVLFILLILVVSIVTACQSEKQQNSVGIEDANIEEIITEDNKPEGGQKPFEDVTKEDIQEVKIHVVPPDVEKNLSEEEIGQLVALLNEVVIYEEVDPESLVGQTVQFDIIKTDGSKFIIQDLGLYFVIDKVYYKTLYEPIEALNEFANKVLNNS